MFWRKKTLFDRLFEALEKEFKPTPAFKVEKSQAFLNTIVVTYYGYAAAGVEVGPSYEECTFQIGTNLNVNKEVFNSAIRRVIRTTKEFFDGNA